jgi:hypothetical protein
MRRIKLVIAAMVVMVAAFAAFAGPAMAADRDDHNWNWNNDRDDHNWNWNNNWNNWNWNNSGFGNGGLIISNGNVGGLGSLGFNNTGFSPFFTGFSTFGNNCWC